MTVASTSCDDLKSCSTAGDATIALVIAATATAMVIEIMMNRDSACGRAGDAVGDTLMVMAKKTKLTRIAIWRIFDVHRGVASDRPGTIVTFVRARGIRCDQ